MRICEKVYKIVYKIKRENTVRFAWCVLSCCYSNHYIVGAVHEPPVSSYKGEHLYCY